MLKSNQKPLGVVMISITALFNIILFFVLPSMIVISWQSEGNAAMTIAKPLALSVLMLIIVLCGYSVIRGKTKFEVLKWLVIGLVFLAINVFIAIVNLN